MIYLDNAATTWPKPEKVKKAVLESFDVFGANPGRGAYPLSLDTSRMIFNTRIKLAQFFDCPYSDRLIFTSGATESMNLALKSLLKKGDHVVYSSMEHNCAWRPLMKMADEGLITLSMVQADKRGNLKAAAFENAIQENTKLIVCIHASNVFGNIMPIGEIGAIAKKQKIPFLVDAAQSGGYVPISVKKDNIDLLVFSGHKGLSGPMGIGGLYVGRNIELDSFIQGGTGSLSHQWEQPKIYPDYLESGTPNVPGICGLGAAIDYLNCFGLDCIGEHTTMLTQKFLTNMLEIPNVKVYGLKPEQPRTPVVSINLKNIDCGEFAFRLDKEYGIAVRSGFHCTPLAHDSLGTGELGTVRFSFSAANTIKDVDAAIAAVQEIAHRN